MKKFNFLTALAALFMAALPMSAAPPLTGAGTEASPYLIRNKADVMALATYVNGTCDGTTATNSQTKAGGDPCAGLFFKVTADIDMANDTTFIGIGSTPWRGAASTGWHFDGTIDGAGHTVSNMRINGMAFKDDGSIITSGYAGSRKYNGFVGTLRTGTVKNLHFDASCSVTSYSHVGMVVGYQTASSTVSGCSNAGTVRSYYTYSGGVVGYSNATSSTIVTLKDCWNSGTVYCNAYNAGGITGYGYYSNISNCVNTGTVVLDSFHSSYGPGRQYAGGGIVGTASTGTNIDNCMNCGTINASQQQAGGIAGIISSTTKTSLKNVVSIGNVNCPALTTGAIVGKIATSTTAPIPVENVYWDASLFPGGQPQIENYAALAGSTTQALTAGTALSGLDPALWTFTAGFYPVMKVGLVAEQTLAAATYLLFPEGTDASNFGTEATISTAGPVTATLSPNAAPGFSISGGKVICGNVTAITQDTVRLANGSYTLIVPVIKIPVLFQGSGTQSDPYLISTPQNLQSMAQMTNGDMREHYTGVYFRQTADIDMSSIPDFKGIACVTTGASFPEKTYWFAGIYDGGGFTISNINVSHVAFDDAGKAISATTAGGCGQNIGLFGSLEKGARISNVHIGAGSSFSGYDNVGSIAGWMGDSVVIANCSSSAAVTAYMGTAGGIVAYGGSVSGSRGAVVERCFNSGPVRANQDEAGGIVGYGRSVVRNCVNTGSVSVYHFNDCYTGTAMEDCGGIVGCNQGNIENCANFGAVSSVGSKTGGITGFTSGGAKLGSVFGCLNAAPVHSSGDMGTCGAIIGDFFSTISVPMLENNVYDLQYTGCAGVNNGDTDYTTALTTAECVAGTVAQLPDSAWTQTAGFYPMLKVFAANPAMKAVAASYVMLPAGQYLNDFRSGTLATAMPLTATVSGSGIFSVSGNSVTTDASAAVIANADLNIVCGDHTRVLPLQYVPNVLPGLGTAESPFLISSAADFVKLGSFMSQASMGFADRHFRVTADIDFTGTEMESIGLNGNWFAGILDGAGHTLSNLTMTPALASTKLANVALFGGVAYGGAIRNLTLAGFNVNANSNGGLLAGTVLGTLSGITAGADCQITGVKNTATGFKGENIGGIAGYIGATGLIDSCVNAAQVTGYKYVGGIVGNSDYSGNARLSRCLNTGTVLAMAPTEQQSSGGAPTYVAVDVCAGGIGGQFAGTVSNCVNRGSVSTNPCRVAGGILGKMYVRATVENCENYGTIYSFNYTAGGIVGATSAATPASLSSVVSCFNHGAVRGLNAIGGIVGQVNSYNIVRACGNMGRVRATGMQGGGIAGNVSPAVSGSDPFARIQDCYNTDSVSGNGYVAGIAGYISTRGLTIEGCFNSGAVVASTANGGAAGITNVFLGPDTVLNCYNTGAITGKKYVGGIVGNSTEAVITNVYNTGLVTCETESNIEQYAGSIVGVNHAKMVITNARFVPGPTGFALDESAGITSATLAQLQANPMGAAFKTYPVSLPLVKSMDTVAAALVSVASYALQPGNTVDAVSRGIALAEIPGLTWTADGCLAMSGDYKAIPHGSAGVGTVTATCGAFSRTFTFKTTTGVDGVDASDPVVGVRLFTPAGLLIENPAPGTVVLEESTLASGRKVMRKTVVR